MKEKLDKYYNFFDSMFQAGFDKEAEEYHEDRKDIKQIVRPSSLGYCMRWKYFDAIGETPTNTSSYQEKVPLWIGTLLHKQFETWAIKSGYDVMTEKNVSWNGISGSVDLICKINGEYYVVDYKGHSGGAKGAYQRAYKEMIDGKINLFNEMQITFYAKAIRETLGIDIQNALIVHYCRDFGYEFKRYIHKFPIRKEIIGKNKIYIDTLTKYVEDETIPPAKPSQFWECGYERGTGSFKKFVTVCPYYSKCKGKK